MHGPLKLALSCWCIRLSICYSFRTDHTYT